MVLFLLFSSVLEPLKMIRVLKKISLSALWYANILSAILLFLSYLAPYISPKLSSWLAILAITYPFLLFLNFFWILFWLFRKSRAIYLSFFTIFIGLAHIPKLIGFNNSVAVNESSFRIMTYNVHYFNTTINRDLEKSKQAQDQILSYIEKQDPDLFFGQEFSGRGEVSSEKADRYLKEKGLKYKHRGGLSSLAIFSKYPLSNKGVISFEGSGNGAIHADVQIQNQKIRIYAIHLQSTKLGTAADEVLKSDNLSTLNKKETQEKYIKVEEKLSNAFEIRAIQAREIAAHIASSPHPVILCGDLNDIPMSYSYRVISKGLKDSFTERGRGLGTSYAGSLPLLRIDYIFTSKQFEVLNHQIQGKAITDHYALTSDLIIKEK